MTLKVVFRRAAQDEFNDATVWYEGRQPGLGSQFAFEVENAVELAVNHPERFPVKHADIRAVHVKRFPYTVFFRPEADRIVVFAIFHARRDPVVWQKRG